MTSIKDALEPFRTYLKQLRDAYPDSPSDTIIVAGPYNLTYEHFETVDQALSQLTASPDREKVARLVFFVSNDGIEYDTPANDALWNAWKDHPDTKECWRAADAILSTIATDEAAIRASAFEEVREDRGVRMLRDDRSSDRRRHSVGGRGMKLTEAQRRHSLLQYYADENAKRVFPPALRRNEARCRALAASGQLEVVGVSVMWGDLYAITPAGRAALEQEGK